VSNHRTPAAGCFASADSVSDAVEISRRDPAQFPLAQVGTPSLGKIQRVKSRYPATIPMAQIQVDIPSPELLYS